MILYNRKMNNNILFLLIIIISIITFILLKSSIKVNNNSSYLNYNDEINNNIVKTSNPNITAYINDIDISNNIGFIDETIKKKEDNSELYLKQFNLLLDNIPNDNSIGFCPIAKSEKKDLPYANVNINLL